MLGTEDYGRIQIGIGPKDPPQIDSADFVYKKFKAAQADGNSTAPARNQRRLSANMSMADSCLRIRAAF